MAAAEMAVSELIEVEKNNMFEAEEDDLLLL